jgi:DNA-binding transcriptional ArsR family regulator|uniref:ArsR family transcriptional regulator n=2 Tax=Bellilinea TaxID=475960 RepID=A0A7C4PZU3_9CHLR
MGNRMPENDLQPVFDVNDLQTMKVLVSRLRLKVLRVLIEQPCTIREVARELNIPPNRLYYHFGLLEQCGAIRVVETRLIAGIVENRYRAVARKYDVRPDLLNEELGEISSASKQPFSSSIEQEQSV